MSDNADEKTKKLMNIDINFFYGSVGKYRRNSETFDVNPETNEKTKFTMFDNNNSLLNLATLLEIGKLKINNKEIGINVKTISYNEWRGESSDGGSSISWNNPPLDFPEQYLKGKRIKFKCLMCNGNDKHTEDCTFQNKNTLICDGEWVAENMGRLNLIEYSNENGVIEYNRIPGNSINQSKTSPKVFQRIELTIEENGNNYFFHVYDFERLRFTHVPIEEDWRGKAKMFIHYLNFRGENILLEPILFEERYSFISQITENERLINKNDTNIGLKIDITKMNTDTSFVKNYQTKYGAQVNYTVLRDTKYYSFKQVFFDCVLGEKIEENKRVRYQNVFNSIGEIVKQKLLKFWQKKRTSVSKTIQSYENIFDLPFVEISTVIHNTGSIQRFYTTETFEGLYLNILFIDCIGYYDGGKGKEFYEKNQEKIEKVNKMVADMFSKCFQFEKIIKNNPEKIDVDFDKFIQEKMIQYDNHERNLTSFKKYTKNNKEPPIPVRNTQPFARGLEPYSFKGRVLYKDSIINYKGKLDRNTGLYYPICIAKTKKNLKEYISALIQGFPKDETEAELYGIDWNNGNPKDNQSGIKTIYEPNGRVIKPLGNIDLNKFKECVTRKSLKYEESSEATEKKFTFLKPLTIEKLFTISGRKIRAQSIPEKSLIAYCNEGTVYYRLEGEILKIPINCNKDGHGYIHNKTFVATDYNNCECKKNILQYCEEELNKSLKDKKIYKLLFFTEEGEGFYWSSKGYPELKCNVDINSVKNLYNVYLKDEDNKTFQVKPNTEKGPKHSTLKEFPRYFFYQTELISKLKSTLQIDFRGENILVNGVYNDFGQIYQGKPFDQTNIVNKELYQNIIKNNLNNNLDLEAILRCFKRKNIENFIKIVSPVNLNFFKINTIFVNKKLKKINIPFSTQEILGEKISDFTKQFIDKEITLFEKSAVFFYDEDDTIKFFYAE